MEVMNADLFSQTETLIGQAGKTRAMGVSDDPMLMSMLSTGFYANPLRTMIQEVMFNAWDAHRMGDCLDKPIDIYIDDTTGLIIRDYGPGISDDDMHPVYCIYGASTKRKDKRQTGGFGLGCKSPFSYTESFTVTSHHNGVKSMYLVSRVSDDAEGKPGLTPLVSVPTTETGLLVTIPLESTDFRRTYRYIKDVLYLSGIKAQIHHEKEEGEYIPELVESREVKPAEYVMESRDDEHDKKVYAVYGGVRYEIVEKEEYEQEFEFISMISEIKSLYIGFAPDTLTPLPNREGLNMSQKTKENIRVGLELCMERFQEVFDPLVQAYFRQRFDTYKAKNIQPHFALYHALGLGNNGDLNFLTEFEKQMKPLVPFNTDPTVWEIAVRLMRIRIGTIMEVVGLKRWISIMATHFMRVYPDSKQLAFNLLKEDPDQVLYNSRYDGERMENMIAEWVQPAQMARLHEFEEKFFKEFKDNGFSKPRIRLMDDGKWVEMVRHKNAGKRPPRTLSYAERQLNLGSDLNKLVRERKRIYDDPNRIWSAKESEEVIQLFMSNTVILAKTVTAMNDTQFKTSTIFHGGIRSDYTSRMSNYFAKTMGVIPGYVIHSRKGGYNAALEMLTDLGFNVIEADEPYRKTYGTKDNPRPIVPQYRRLDVGCTNWQRSEIDPHDEDYDEKEDGKPLTEPTHYLYVKQSNLSDHYYRKYLKPDEQLVKQMLALYPDIAMVHNQAQADALEKKGVKPFHEIVIDWHRSMTTKVYRFRNIVRVMRVMEKSNIPDRMLRKSQTIQAAMGIAKIDPEDTSFWSEMALINNISTENYEPLKKTASEMSKLVSDTFSQDPQYEKVKANIKASLLLSERAIDYKWHGLSLEDREEFEKKVARFIRTL